MKCKQQENASKVAEQKKMKQAAVRTAARTKTEIYEKEEKASPGMYLIIRCPNSNGGGGVLDMERPVGC
jgi:hypothetical protein